MQRLGDIFPETTHVDRLGLAAAQDEEIWEYAGKHGFTIVTKDSDFHDKSLLKGSPPKVIWVRKGNCTVRQIEVILRNHQADIENLHQNDQLTCLVLY